MSTNLTTLLFSLVVSIPAFLEKVKETRKLEISLDVLNNDDLLKKLKESAINLLTIEIQSRCELQEVVKRYSLPSCLKIIRIHNNYLNCQDVFALGSSLTSVNGLHELDLSGTKFEEYSFFAFISVLTKCSELRKFCLTDNYLTGQELTCLPAAFESMNNLRHLNLSGSNLTEPQASNILEKLRQLQGMVCLDLSRNELRGMEIVSGICQLQSVEELNLSYTGVKFYPLPNLEQQHDKLAINAKSISVSSNNMTPKDIVSFVTLIRSDLLKLNVDFNHVGNSIWALCSLKVKHLKVLSLANTDVCGPAVEGLVFLLSLAEELEELDLSCNNLMLNDFLEFQSPLSNLTRLRKLNLSNNPIENRDVLEKILPSFKHMEELRLSNTRLKGDDLCKIKSSLVSLKSLSYVDLSNNAIGPEGAKALAEVLKEFTLLETLDLSRSCMKEDDTSILFTSLTSLKNLKYMDLSGNRIDIEFLHGVLLLPSSLEEVIFSDIIHGEKLFTSMKKLKRVKKLHFSEMNLSPCDVDAFVSMLSSFSSLEELALTDIHVPGCKWERIFGAISFKNVKKLHLSGLKLFDEEALFGMLSSLSCLEVIVFSDVDLVHMAGFFAALESLSCLKILDLQSERTKISAIDAEDLVRVLPSLQRLEKLALRVFQFDGSQEQLFKAVGKLRYLKKLRFIWVFPHMKEFQALAEVLPLLQLMQKLDFRRISDDESQNQLFDAVGKLRYLKKLALSEVRLNQTGKEALATALKSLQLLEKLKLGHVSFDGEDLEQLFDAVGKLKNLKKLTLSCVWLNQTGTETLATTLSSLQLLEKLKLNDLSFNSEGQEQVFDAVGKLRHLKKLALSNTRLNQTGTKALATALSSLQLLEKLQLREVNFDSEDLEQLFHAVGKLRYLKEFSLFCISLIQTGIEALATPLPSLQLLEKLTLDGVVSDREGQEQLFDAVGQLKYLKELALFNARLNQTGTEALAAALPLLRLLEKLNLEDFSVDSEDLEQLCGAVGKLRYLKKLTLLYVPLNQTSTEALATALPSLQLLDKLELTDIVSDHEGQEQLFDAVGKLRYLKKLRVYCISLSQQGTEALAATLASLQLLEKLTLEVVVPEHKGQEQLFDALGQLKYLKELSLLNARLNKTGTEALAAALPSLQLLEKLTLLEVGDDNEDQEQLFDAVGKLRYLKKLTLSHVELNQSGAEALATALPSLQLLDKLQLENVVWDNEGQKQLFDAIGKLRYLKAISLSCLSLSQTGTEALATALPSLQFLEKLSLTRVVSNKEGNKKLFNAMGKLRYLKELNLRFGRLNQTCTEALARVLFLERLRLVDMFFEDESVQQFFTSVQSLRFLRRLDLALTEITQRDAETLFDVLLTLQHLRYVCLPGVNCDHEESDEEKRERRITFKNGLKKELPELIVE